MTARLVTATAPRAALAQPLSGKRGRALLASVAALPLLLAAQGVWAADLPTAVTSTTSNTTTDATFVTTADTNISDGAANITIDADTDNNDATDEIQIQHAVTVNMTGASGSDVLSFSGDNVTLSTANGSLTVTDGTVNSIGTLTNSSTNATGVSIAAAGAITATTITNSSGATFTTSGDTDFTTGSNAGTFTVATGGDVDGANFTNTGDFNFNGGAFDLTGTYTQDAATATTDIASGLTFTPAILNSAGTITNNGTLSGTVENAADAIINNNGTISGDVSNAGIINMADGSEISGAFEGTADTSTVNIDGEATISGAVTGTTTFDMTGNAATGDILNFTSDTAVAAGNSFLLDYDNGSTSTADLINFTTPPTATQTITINPLNGATFTGAAADIITGATSLDDFSFTSGSGAVVLSPTFSGGTISIASQLSPVVSGMAQDLSFAQSLGALIANDGQGLLPQQGCNREDVNGLALDSRVSHGGFGKKDGTEMTGRYSNWTLGLGTDCLYLGDSNWRALLNGELGFTNVTGKSDFVNPFDSTESLGQTRLDGTIFSVGVNAKLENLRFTTDQSLRFDFGNLTLNNDNPANATNIALTDAQQSQSAIIYAGTLGAKLGDPGGAFRFEPRVSYQVSFLNAGDVDLNQGTLTTDSAVGLMAGLGATLTGKVALGAGLDSQFFVSGDVKNDFTGARDSVYTLGTASETISSDGLGTFADLGAGLRFSGNSANSAIAKSALELGVNSQIGGSFSAVGLGAKLRLGF